MQNVHDSDVCLLMILHSPSSSSSSIGYLVVIVNCRSTLTTTDHPVAAAAAVEKGSPGMGAIAVQRDEVKEESKCIKKD